MTDHAQQVGEQPGRLSDSEVPEKPVRRRFDAAYKQRIVEEADGCSQPGELGLLLRREGLYASLLSTWKCLCRRSFLQNTFQKNFIGSRPPPGSSSAREQVTFKGYFCL